MKIRPILFNSDMVRALLDGSKTQTRRPMPEWQIPKQNDDGEWIAVAQRDPRWGFVVSGDTEEACATKLQTNGTCPHGRKGNMLYVRETFACCGSRLTYRADDDGAHCVVTKWIPSIHMPRCESRITLEITDIHVERVQDIDTEDIKKEGVNQRFPNVNDQFTPLILQGQFIEIWNSIYKNWHYNPWVWVIEFRVINSNVDKFIEIKTV